MKFKNLFNILKEDKPIKRIIGKIILRLPFAIQEFVPIKIKIQDYCIWLSQNALSISYWINSNERISDYLFIKDYLKKEDTYIDIGANIGTTVIPAALKINEGRCIAFEPHPKTFDILKRNVLLNRLDNKIELHNYALGNKIGYVNFSSVKNDDVNKVISDNKGVEVTISKLDEFNYFNQNVNLIKIDVEGFEKFVIEGAIKTLKKTECVYFEMSEEQYNLYGYSVMDVIKILEGLKFKIFLLKEPRLIQCINSDHKLNEHHTNAFAIRNVEEFIKRTSWKIFIDRNN